MATEDVNRAARDLLPGPGHTITSTAKPPGVCPATFHHHIPDLKRNCAPVPFPAS